MTKCGPSITPHFSPGPKCNGVPDFFFLKCNGAALHNVGLARIFKMLVTPQRPSRSRQIVSAANSAIKYAPYAKALFSAGKTAAKLWRGTKRSRSGRPKNVTVVKGADKRLVYRSKSKGRRKPSLKKQVANLAKRVKNSVHTYRQTDGGGVAAAINQCGYFHFIAWDTAKLLTPSTTAPFLLRNSGTTDSILTVNRNATASKINFQAYMNCFSELHLRNNELVDQEVTVYIMECKQSTNLQPLTIMTNELSNSTVSAGSVLNPLLYPTDINGLQSTWKIMKTHKFELSPGDHTKLVTTMKFKYDPRDLNGGLTYTSKRSRIFFVRIRGGIAGVNATDNAAGRTACSLDGIVTTTLRLTYEGDGTRTTAFLTTGLAAAPDEMVQEDNKDEL